MGLSGSSSRRSEESSSSSSRQPKSLTQVQDELVKKYASGAVVILTRTPPRSADDFRREYLLQKYPTCEEWIQQFYKLQRLCRSNCPEWSKIRIETSGLEVCPEKLLLDSRQLANDSNLVASGCEDPQQRLGLFAVDLLEDLHLSSLYSLHFN